MDKYKIRITNKFKKEFKKMKTRNNFNEEEFIKVINILARGEQIPQKYCNHILKPKEEGIWECHIKPNWILIYTKTEDTLILIRTGNHADLFE